MEKWRELYSFLPGWRKNAATLFNRMIKVRQELKEIPAQ